MSIERYLLDIETAALEILLAKEYPFKGRLILNFRLHDYADLNRLSIGEEVYLVREPLNPHDSNAVAVWNQNRRELGYLKREVGVWFAPILDKGRKFQCFVKQRTASGGIVIAVYD